MKQISLMIMVSLAVCSLITIATGRLLYYAGQDLIAVLGCIGFGFLGLSCIFVMIWNHKKGIIKL